MKYQPVQVLTPHSSACRLCHTEPSRVWVLPEHVGWGQDWLRFRCNDPACHGLLIVYLPTVMAWLDGKLREGK